MKFGKEFAAEMVPEWHQAYRDYNFLKLMLKDLMRFRTRPKPVLKPPTGGLKKAMTLKKAITFRAFSGLMKRDNQSPRNEEEIILVKNMEQDGNDSYETTFLMNSSDEGTEYDVVFFKRLDEELNKVNAFYRSRVGELVNEAAVLDKQMSSLLAFRAIVRNKAGQDFNTSTDTDAAKTPRTTGIYSGPAQMEVINEIETNADGTVQTESMHGRAETEALNEIEMSGRGFKTPRTAIETSGHGFETPGVKAAPAERPIRQKLRSNNKPHPIEIIRDVKIMITPDTPRSTIRGLLNNPGSNTLSRKDLRRANDMVRTAFIEFYEKLTLVKSYSSLNLLAFSKILKKYDKASSNLGKGFHRVVWEYCCLPKDFGGLGLTDIGRQGSTLAAKWIIQPCTGNEAWKILIHNCICQGTPQGRKTWQGLDFHNLLIIKAPVKIVGTFLVKSIWKAWELLKPFLLWEEDGFRNGLSINDHNIWWSPLINFHDVPLAQVPWVHALKLFRRGLRTLKDIFCRQTRLLLTWPQAKAKFRLASVDIESSQEVLDSILAEMLHKVGISSLKPWWKDWKWFPDTPLLNYSPGKGYALLTPRLPMVALLNSIWSINSGWSSKEARFHVVWKAIIQPKLACFA
ncbi:hypothetical protein KI387_038599 [Taxus chinensis]|uniref:SPX domain-containing protein n=1 Tax=Taxus chinensis TaxID=29808 RepID=A0AA38C529_TAXCH|nr:hypothetical protein KI387_038599 [Taxus chinensis]